ncbi:uncharacterized protein PRCAT00001457001 [Priceomyces carsonii]|uniref:uncharacterized protein n=1 Tax=Priceomyces carsonii TaxID=28549 RepID=UPI002EDA7A57|nr:unnamed protein product [Priceomyces carsonii]
MVSLKEKLADYSFEEDQIKGYDETLHAARDKFGYAYEKKLLRRIDLRLMPLLILLYLCKNLDVNNAGFVKTMNVGASTNILSELNMSVNDWAWVSTIYTIPFILFEIPSTLILKKSTPRIHQFRIAFLWGSSLACHAAVKNKAGLLSLRFLLGMFEAGMFPGALCQLTYWYRPDEITVRMAFLGVLGQFSSILTAFITYGFQFADTKAGLSGWQWVFLIEGLVTILCSFLLLIFLPNFPSDAKFLTQEEREFIMARLPINSPRASDMDFSRKDIERALKRPLTYSFTCLKMFQNLGGYGLSFWLPTIVQSFGFTTTNQAQLISIPPAALAIISGIFFSWISDRGYIPKPYIVLLSLSLAIPSFICLTVITNKAALYAFICVATMVSSADGSVLTSWLQQSLIGSTEVMFSFAFSNAWAQIGGIIGPQLFRSEYAPRYTLPYGISLMFLGLALVSLVVTWYLTIDVEKQTRRIKKLRLLETSKGDDGEIIYEDVTVTSR